MTALSRFFLTAKHWQLFVLLFGTMTVAQIAMFAATLSTETNTMNVLTGIVTLPFIAALLYWFWVLGSFLHSITEPQIRLPMGFFRIALLCPAIYIPLFAFLFPNFTPGLSLLFTVHMFATFCMFYLLYFVSKSLVLAETGRPTGFYDFAGPLFLIWFFPLGVWFVQPRINRLFARKQIDVPTGPVTSAQPMTKSRAEAINAMPPQLIADMHLYPTEKGGKEHAVHPGWGCPCAKSINPEVVGNGTHEHPLICRDGWPQLTEPLLPGETRRAGFVFLSPEASVEFREAGVFYLWEGRFIGEATVVRQDGENRVGIPVG